MLRFCFVIFIIPIMVSVSEDCKDFADLKTNNITWPDFIEKTWYEMYRADNSHSLECTTVKYEKIDNAVNIYYKGNKEENNVKEKILKGTIDKNLNSIYTLEDSEIQKIIMFKKDAYAIVYGCNKNEPAKPIYKLWILSIRPTMNFLDVYNIKNILNENKIAPDLIEYENIRTTLHSGKFCNSGSAIQALAILITASAILVKLL